MSTKLKQTLIESRRDLLPLFFNVITYSNTILINLIIITNHKTQRRDNAKKARTKERERRVKLKTQPFFLPWHFNDCRNNLEEFSLVPHRRPGLDRDGRRREREKRWGERRKGAKF